MYANYVISLIDKICDEIYFQISSVFDHYIVGSPDIDEKVIYYYYLGLLFGAYDDIVDFCHSRNGLLKIEL